MTVTKSCVICGDSFIANGRSKTCSNLHSAELQKKNERKFRFNARMFKSCVDCGCSLRNFHYSKSRCQSCGLEQLERKKEYARERYGNDPAHRERMLEIGRKNYRNRYDNDKEFRERQRRRSRESWANGDPAHRKHVLEYTKKRRANSPTYNKQRKEYYRWRYDNDPAFRERLSNYQKKIGTILAAFRKLGYIPKRQSKRQSAITLAALRRLGYIPTGDSK